MNWRETRKLALNRDGWKCCACAQTIKGRNAHVHHKLPRALGGTDELGNLISLCSGCHSLKHMNLQASLGRRLIERLAMRVAKIFDKETLADIRGDTLGLALRYLKVEKLRSGQLQPILAALAGKSVLFISPTGSGKSLCFQLPALISPKKSIVISPLKVSMSDQVSGLLNRDFPATFLNSDLSKGERETRLELISQNKVKLVYIAPERLEAQKHRKAEQEILFDDRPDYLIVDEAHCIVQWGDAFRPQYAQIGAAAKNMGNPPVLAFTATAGQKTRNQILENLNINDAKVFVEGVDRPNIALARFRSHSDDKKISLVQKLFLEMRSKTDGKALIFVSTIKEGEKICLLAQSVGLETEFFHGQLEPSRKDFLLARFGDRHKPKLDLLICTNAFGMGVDIPNIRLVFHWQHPASTEHYLQEFGRAGRDGKQSLAVLFTSQNDTKILEFMLKKTLDSKDLSKDDWRQRFFAKKTSIDLISQMASKRDKCFTELLKSDLDVDHKKSNFIARFILELVFSKKQNIQSRKFCCDGCFRKTQRNKVKPLTITDFTLSVVHGMGE